MVPAAQGTQFEVLGCLSYLCPLIFFSAHLVSLSLSSLLISSKGESKVHLSQSAACDIVGWRCNDRDLSFVVLL